MQPLVEVRFTILDLLNGILGGHADDGLAAAGDGCAGVTHLQVSHVDDGLFGDGVEQCPQQQSRAGAPLVDVDARVSATSAVHCHAIPLVAAWGVQPRDGQMVDLQVCASSTCGDGIVVFAIQVDDLAASDEVGREV